MIGADPCSDNCWALMISALMIGAQQCHPLAPPTCASHQCLSVPSTCAQQCHPPVLSSAASQCHLSVPITAA
ncbi:unnamed protein product, partial [Staurois parvus]